MSDCLFCKIAAGEIPSTCLYDDDDVYAFRDINPQMPVHFLVIPKQHIDAVASITADNSAVVAKCFEVIAKLAAQEGLTGGYRVISNCGDDAAQCGRTARCAGAGSALWQQVRHRAVYSGARDPDRRAGRRSPSSIEIIPKQGFYDYANKYQPGAAEEVCPSPIPAEWEAKIAAAAKTVFHTIGLSVYSRADFIVTEDGTPYFLEINNLPGMTPPAWCPRRPPRWVSPTASSANALCLRRSRREEDDSMEALTLNQIAAAVHGRLLGEGFDAEQTVSEVCTDSRKIKKGCLFLPLVGEKFDGHDYIGASLEARCRRLPDGGGASTAEAR